MDKLDTSMQRILAFRDERDWKQFHTPKDLALSMMIEAGELAEHVLWKDEEQQMNPSPEIKQEIADELADVFHYVLLFAEKFGIDLEQASKDKLEKTKLKYPVEKCKGKLHKYTHYQTES